MVDTGLRLPIRSGTRAHQPTRARPATSSERATYSRREEWQRARSWGRCYNQRRSGSWRVDEAHVAARRWRSARVEVGLRKQKAGTSGVKWRRRWKECGAAMDRVDDACGSVVCKWVAVRGCVGGGVGAVAGEGVGGSGAHNGDTIKLDKEWGAGEWRRGGLELVLLGGRAHEGEQCLTQRRAVRAAGWARDTRTRRLRRWRERSGRGCATQRKTVRAVAQT